MFKVEVGKQRLGKLPQVPSIFHKVTSTSIGERSRTRTTYSTAIDRAVFHTRIIQCAFTEVSCPLVHPCLFVDFPALERSMHETKHNCIMIYLNSEAVVANVLSQYVLRNNQARLNPSMWLPEGKARLLPYGLAETLRATGPTESWQVATLPVTLKFPGRFEASLPVRLVLNWKQGPLR